MRIASPIARSIFGLVLLLAFPQLAGAQEVSPDATPDAASESAAEETAAPSWELELGLSYVATSGNSDTSSGGVEAAYTDEWEVWSLEAAAFALRAEDQGVVTAERYGASFGGARELTERLLLTAGLALEQDEFSGIELRSVFGLGLERIWVDSESWSFKSRASLTWTREELVAASGADESFGALLGASGKWKLSENASASSKLTYFPNFDDSDDYRFDGELGVQAAINSAWALKLAYQLRYDNQPVPGFDTTDTTTTASLVLKLPRG